MIEYLDKYTQTIYDNMKSIKAYKKEYLKLPDQKWGNEDVLMEKYPKLDKMKSVYIWGDPGCGKSFLMEQFYEHLNVKKKKMLHYQEFML